MENSEKKSAERFNEEYAKLNKAQREAVDTIDGPVMVVAGPGTGKTQILALRIGNILLKTDSKADSVLCLTFTNAAVSAMKERLFKYIGAEASRVNIFTFHGFGMRVLEEYYEVLGLDSAPKTMDEADAIVLADQILHGNDWQYLRPRSDSTRYFRDLKSLVSLLKRERITPNEFLREVDAEIKELQKKTTKQAQMNVESLSRTREVVKFFELYEEAKKKQNLFDYDDILENLVKIVEESTEVRDEIREKYLYVLIDEHQDSSGVQNEFLEKVWSGTERPNIFVVGDDRQLIYGFGGASLEYFENFKHAFGRAKLITLVENYRSTQIILDSADELLESTLSKEKLKSQSQEKIKLRLVEADYPRDEILACALDIQEKVKKGLNINDCAILVPKNRQVRSAITILRDLGIPVSGGGSLRFFDSSVAESLLRVLYILSDPYDNVALAESFFDPLSNIHPLEAHKFIREHNMRGFSLAELSEKNLPTLFGSKGGAEAWISKLLSWLEKSRTNKVYSLVQVVSDEFLLDTAPDHETLVSRVEVVRTLLHLILLQIEKNPKLTLKELMEFLRRLELYDEDIPLSVFGSSEGVKVLTLHGSKGLEFDYVWIAHLDQRNFGSNRKRGFTLPEAIEARIEKKDEEVLKRQLYVAITRAKRFCTLSFAEHSYTGSEQELAHIVAALPENIFDKQASAQTEKAILGHDPKAYIEKKKITKHKVDIKELTKIVAKEYPERKVSVSLLNNFFECPWKWYFRNLLLLPEPQEESLEFGNAVHTSIDKILKLQKTPTEKDIEKIAGENKEVLKIVSKWIKQRLGEINKERESEKSVSAKDDKFPHLNIYGKIDLVENLSKNELRVTDFKTGSVKKKSDIEKLDEEGRMSAYLRQLAMYSYLLERASKSKVRESRLEFLEAKNDTESIYDRVVTAKEIELLIKDIKDYDALVKSGEWTQRPCNYNSYGKNTECEYCKRAEIYK